MVVVIIKCIILFLCGGDRRGCDRMVVGLQLHVQTVSITNNVVSSNPDHGEVYSIQHYVIKFFSDFRQGCGFLWILRFSPTNKTDRHDKTEILLKVALGTIIL